MVSVAAQRLPHVDHQGLINSYFVRLHSYRFQARLLYRVCPGVAPTCIISGSRVRASMATLASCTHACARQSRAPERRVPVHVDGWNSGGGLGASRLLAMQIRLYKQSRLLTSPPSAKALYIRVQKHYCKASFSPSVQRPTDRTSTKHTLARRKSTRVYKSTS